MSELSNGSDNALHSRNAVTLAELYVLFTKYDLKRIHLYARHLVDYHLVVEGTVLTSIRTRHLLH